MLLLHYIPMLLIFSIEITKGVLTTLGTAVGLLFFLAFVSATRPSVNTDIPTGPTEPSSLLAVLAEANFVLHSWLRSGNTGAGQGLSVRSWRLVRRRRLEA